MLTTWEEMTELEQAQCLYWDMYKDAHGHRPRGIDTSAWTLADFQEQFKYLGRVVADNEQQREEAEQRAQQDFELRVQNLRMSGARSREQALRWIHEAEGTQGDDEQLCWQLGLGFGYLRGETLCQD